MGEGMTMQVAFCVLHTLICTVNGWESGPKPAVQVCRQRKGTAVPFRKAMSSAATFPAVDEGSNKIEQGANAADTQPNK
jgi:hypothetical protein